MDRVDLTSGSSGSDAPLTVSVSCIHCIVLFGARWPEACELCLACPPPPSMSQLAQWLSDFYRFTVAPPERDCSGAHARSLARCLPWALAHQCRMYNGTSRADADGFVRLMPCAAWRLGLPARSDGFFIPYRVPIRVPYGQHDGQRANLSAGGSSQQYRPATLGPGHRATIVWLRAAVLLSAWRYPWALPRR